MSIEDKAKEKKLPKVDGLDLEDLQYDTSVVDPIELTGRREPEPFDENDSWKDAQEDPDILKDDTEKEPEKPKLGFIKNIISKTRGKLLLSELC